MTNKDMLISLSSEDFYRKVKNLYDTMTKKEMIEWLSAEYIKPKKITKIAHNKNQKCPHCGQTWVWSQGRWMTANTTGRLILTCKRCKKYFVAYDKNTSNIANS